jgi:uncharacterized protein
MSLETEYKEKIIGILTVLFPTAKIYLFGSRVGDKHAERADIDIAIEDVNNIEPRQMGEAKNMLAESLIPYSIDIVNFHKISKEMQYFIKRDGILWKS